LIDEYDNLLMRAAGTEIYGRLRGFLAEVFEIALKDNESLEKALLTGVTRISKESLLSGLNNLKVYDVFQSGPYDEDFGLTESEARTLFPETKWRRVKRWYNNVHIGGAWMYYIYSVISCYENNKFADYWGRSGTMETLINLLTPNRASQIAELIQNRSASRHCPADMKLLV
jgi:hypothetical protein